MQLASISAGASSTSVVCQNAGPATIVVWTSTPAARQRSTAAAEAGDGAASARDVTSSQTTRPALGAGRSVASSSASANAGASP